MRVKIFSCLLAFILGCNFTAAIINRITTEDGHVFLNCPDSVTGKVTWSRESRGNRIDVMTTDGHEDIKHIHDPNKRFRSFGKKILGILRATISDAGLYFCNSEPAMELTVIPSGSNKIQTTAAAATEPSTAVTETDVGSYGDRNSLFNHHDQHHCQLLEESSTNSSDTQQKQKMICDPSSCRNKSDKNSTVISICHHSIQKETVILPAETPTTVTTSVYQSLFQQTIKFQQNIKPISTLLEQDSEFIFIYLFFLIVCFILKCLFSASWCVS
ncbi:uncharacterized protein LOC121958105 isoform X1 [Plectropomus leopardus]|uniref:uncharacterized protein LOC121958105 isoform X1 n=1 Tax=Plectropomus leopardus TaxID=160734 RepID=UPI001C4C6B89|nr:uncharacterized protein LOC121958105 isoform X1 [Plectropomus leopardus]